MGGKVAYSTPAGGCCEGGPTEEVDIGLYLPNIVKKVMNRKDGTMFLI